MTNFRTTTNKFNQRASAIFEHSEPLLPIMGMFSIIWHMACYFIWDYLIPQPYENIWMRMCLALLAIPLVLHSKLKRSFSRFYPTYYLFYVLFFSPFFFFFMTIKNEWSTVWTMSTLCGILVIIPFVYEWIFIGTLMTAAFVMAYLAVGMLDGHVHFIHMQWSYLPVFLFGISGSLVGTRWTHLRHESKVSLMKSLSGTIAHEMRTPLNAITFAIDAIKAMLPERIDANCGNVMIPDAALAGIRDIIDQGDETIRRSNKIIDSILASLKGSEIDRRQFGRYTAGQVITAAIDNCGFETPEDRKMVHLDISHDFDFFGDRDLLTHTLFNLIGNALYYRSKPGFCIDITTSTGPQGNHIIVRDTGPGVPRDKREAIFGQFYTFGKSGGNGLGLSFCRRVAESFGGSIVCRSSFGEWTEFVIELPAYDSNTVEQLKQELVARKQILVVDDQAPNRIMLSKLLAELNCRADQAENGRIALDMAAKKRYDLILMDIEMPVLNGDDAVRELRSGNDIEPSMALHYREIPIIAITGLPENEAKRRTLQSGMDDYVLKPIGRERVKEIVELSFFSEKPEKEGPPLTGLAGASILLVDDNIMTREFLKALLEPLGYRIFQADNGMMAIDMLRELKIDLVIMDLEMPVMGGIETAKVIRTERLDRLREAPIISLSGHTDEKTVSDAMNAGTNIHLGKPVRKHELLNAISTLLTRSTRHDQVTTVNEQALKSPWIEMETVPILDESIVESLQSLGDEDFLVQLFSLFVQDAEKIIGELAEACRQNDHDTAQRSSHTLKGSAASIGAARIQAIATRVNELLRNQQCPEEDGWVEYLQHVFGLTSEAFSKYSGSEA
jgi:two-component system CAI-1 autoinducer sensor kinase/phosphatase CqsS